MTKFWKMLKAIVALAHKVIMCIRHLQDALTVGKKQKSFLAGIFA